MQPQFVMQWVDLKRRATQPPNPDYPDGIDIDGTKSGEQSCKVALPYPAAQCGLYQIGCTICGFNMAIATAGRPDDPRSVRMPCARCLH